MIYNFYIAISISGAFGRLPRKTILHVWYVIYSAADRLAERTIKYTYNVCLSAYSQTALRRRIR